MPSQRAGRGMRSPYARWESSLASPMASNVQWHLYDCGEASEVGGERTTEAGGPPPGQDHLMLQQLHNEQVVPFPVPGCDKRALCPVTAVLEFYAERLEALGAGNCDEKEFLADDVCGGYFPCA